MSRFFPSFNNYDYMIGKETYYVNELEKLQNIYNPVFVEIMLHSDETKKLIEMKKQHIEVLEKMKEAKEEKCDFCNDIPSFNSIKLYSDVFRLIELYGQITLLCYGNTLKIHHCPMCGRKLKIKESEG